ncbi:MAG: GMC family oxidoreductase [Limisphaerales bacterium]
MVGYDFIVVGAGTAGCVLARRLLERTQARVLLIEAGVRYPGLLLSPPLPGMKFGRGFSWGQRSLPQARLGNRRIEWPMGKVVGGTSSVNAMMAYLGHPANFDAWERAGNPGWSARALGPYFQRVFGTLPGEAAGETAEGMLSLSELRFHAPFSEAFLAACEEDGMRRESPLIGRHADSCGYFPVLQRRGERFESARGYLGPVRNHPRLTLITGAHVRRVMFSGDKAVGIEAVFSGKLEQWRATTGVVLCAGVFETPRILHCSGLGPAEVLRAAGIEVRRDLPQVGLNFQDHVRVGMLYRSGRVSPGAKRWWIPGVLRYLLRRDGVMASNCCESGAFLGSRPDREVPDLQLITHFQTFGPKGEVDIEVCLVDPTSRGRVFVSPRDPYGAPLIDPNYLETEEDLLALEAGIRRVRSIAARAPLRSFPLLEEISPGQDETTGRGLREAIFRTATTAYHPCGTCGMGPGGVLDSGLRVRGAEALWVADASAMPALPSGNIACAVLVLAEKAADLIQEATEARQGL